MMKQMPDLCGVEMVQELADTLVSIQPLISQDDYALLLGIGGALMKQADEEMKAGIQAFVALRRALPHPPR